MHLLEDQTNLMVGAQVGLLFRKEFKRKKSSSLNEIFDKHNPDLEQQSLSSNGTIFSDNYFSECSEICKKGRKHNL